MPKKFYQDDKGNDSSFRINFTYFMLSIVTILAILIALVVKESYRPEPDYEGLSTIITAFLGGGSAGLLFKALSKFFER